MFNADCTSDTADVQERYMCFRPFYTSPRSWSNLDNMDSNPELHQHFISTVVFCFFSMSVQLVLLGYISITSCEMSMQGFDAMR